MKTLTNEHWGGFEAMKASPDVRSSPLIEWLLVFYLLSTSQRMCSSTERKLTFLDTVSEWGSTLLYPALLKASVKVNRDGANGAEPFSVVSPIASQVFTYIY